MEYARPFAALVILLAGACSLLPAQENGSQDPAPLTQADSKVTPPSINAPASGVAQSKSSSATVLPVRSVIEVKASAIQNNFDVTVPHHFTSEEVLSSAGTWGDFTRYLELLPGVVWNSDITNDIYVRGGNPLENLFVVDGIEVPNINHIAREGTTGGFTSMLDTSSVQSVDMYPGIYDVRYSSRLSSLIEIHTRSNPSLRQEKELHLGISGAGGLLHGPVGKHGSMLLSAHRGLLDRMTDDIGINGVPVYTNGFGKLEWSPGNRDHFSLISLNGADSIDITPQPCDPGVTLGVQTQYAGVRSTYGFAWQHTHSARGLSTLSSSYFDQRQTIGQQEQSPVSGPWEVCISTYKTRSVYDERTRDRGAYLNYELQLSRGDWVFSMGSNGRLLQVDYAVAQPLGQQSPFSTDPAWTDADSFKRNFLTGQAAVYAQASGRIGDRLTVLIGARHESYALTGSHALNPRASLSFRINAHQTLSASWQRLSQLPPVIQLLSYPENSRLGTTSVEQVSTGAELWNGRYGTISATAYRKNYSNEPVSIEYPSLMLANMVDLLAQQFAWLPLKGGGWGHTQGLEITTRTHWRDRIRFMGSLAYSRTHYAAADGVLRPGNFDFPLVGNGIITGNLPFRLQMSVRDTYASGRPYTPFNFPLSIEQSRPIYDLARVNAWRGPAYNRVDVDLNRTFRFGATSLVVNGGVNNVFDRPNFLGFAWESNCHGTVDLYCGWTRNAIPGIPMAKATQMPRFPSAGVRFIF